jgi:hypothetical protein
VDVANFFFLSAIFPLKMKNASEWPAVPGETCAALQCATHERAADRAMKREARHNCAL